MSSLMDKIAKEVAREKAQSAPQKIKPIFLRPTDPSIHARLEKAAKLSGLGSINRFSLIAIEDAIEKVLNGKRAG